MKILVGIPVVTGYRHTEDAINSVLNQSNVELLIVDNNATEDIKELFKNYDLPNATIKVNEKNIYVNPAWNQIMFHFLASDCDLLVIMNSDLTMQNNWAEILRKHYRAANASYLPTLLSDRVKLERMNSVEFTGIKKRVTGSTAGVFITLNKEQCKLVYDIPELIKVWFGDNWIYDILRGCGYNTYIAEDLFGFHGLSQTIDRVPEVVEIIEEDKRMWYKEVRPYMNELIMKLNDSTDLSEQNSRED